MCYLGVKVYGGLVGGVGAPEVIPEQVVAVHLGFEAGDVTVAKVFAEFIDFLQLQQVDPQDLDCLHHLGRGGGAVSPGVCLTPPSLKSPAPTLAEDWCPSLLGLLFPTPMV